MRGIILAGGLGTRLRPLTNITNKHLIAIYDQPMILYPLQTLIQAGIKDILIVSGREHAGHFVEFLGSGRDYGARFSYKVQDEAGGIAQALLLAEDFAAGQPVTIILGDNIYEDNFSATVKSFRQGARIFIKKVLDPERFGVPVFKGKKIVAVLEKPKKPPSVYAVTGLYQYDSKVFDIIRQLKPSQRGELEVADVMNHYIKAGTLDFDVIKNYWSDAGTFESLSNSIQWAMHRKIKP